MLSLHGRADESGLIKSIFLSLRGGQNKEKGDGTESAGRAPWRRFILALLFKHDAAQVNWEKPSRN